VAAAALVLFLASLLFYETVMSSSRARLALLRTVDPGAFAVHIQIVHNYATSGEFFQTIREGYSDSWDWSGHRAITLLITSFFYRFDPQPLTLIQVQTVAMALGVIPAALIGRRALRKDWGLLVGGLIYLGSPAVMAMALQDYQDLVFAVPALTFTMWAVRGPLWLVPIGVLVGCLPREECLPLAVAAAAVCPPPGALRRWVASVGLAALTAGGLWAYLSWRFPIAESDYQMPLYTMLSHRWEGLLNGEPLFVAQQTLAFTEFYPLLGAPLWWPALLSPLALLPALGVVGLHIQLPCGIGFDRSWLEHAHHLALALPFVLVAMIEGTGRALRWAPRLLPAALGRASSVAAPLAALGLLIWMGWWDRGWAGYINLLVTAKPVAPSYQHPLWALAEQIPEDAVPIAATHYMSLVIADRPVSYTIQSLRAKEEARGLGAGTHLLLDERMGVVHHWAMSMPGAEVIAESSGHQLIAWEPGAVDSLRLRTDVTRFQDAARLPSIPGVPPKVAASCEDSNLQPPPPR